MVDRCTSGALAWTISARSSALWCPGSSKIASRSNRRELVTRPPLSRTRARTSSTVLTSCRGASAPRGTPMTPPLYGPARSFLQIIRICLIVAIATGQASGAPRRAHDMAGPDRSNQQDSQGTDLPGVGQGGPDGGDHRRPQHRGLGNAGPRAPRSPPHQQDGALRLRDRRAGLHARHAPRLRRRSHRGDRQHDPQADPGRRTPAQRRVLLLTGSLDHRLRSRRAPELRDPGTQRGGAEQHFRSASLDRHHRHLDLGDVPLPHRPAEPRCPLLHPQGEPGDAPGQIRRCRAASVSSMRVGS